MKARTQGQKRRAKRVRVVEAGSDTIAAQTAYTGEYGGKSAYSETVEVRARHYSVSEVIAAMPECGYSLGRLLLYQERHGLLTAEQARDYLDAGSHFAWIVTDYMKDVLGSPRPTPAAMDINRVGGLSCDAVDPDHIKSVTNRYMGIEGLLGRARMHALRELIICEAEVGNWPDVMVRDAMAGLRAISDQLNGK